MYQHPPAIRRLAESLMCLPGIGPKTANRLAYHLLDAPSGEVDEMIRSLKGIQQDITRCVECGNYAEGERCSICQSGRRDRGVLCVVGQAKDVPAFERTGEFKGVYHVLGGLISPMDGRGPEQLNIDSLLQRISQGDFREIVLATDPTVAGEATALYLEHLLEEFPGEISRLALGIPVGSDFEYTDEITLGRALSYRQTMRRNE